MPTDIDILIVEDSPTQAFKLQYDLEWRGCRVTLATNGRAAIECMAAHTPDVVVSDIIMPPIGLFLGGMNFTDIQIVMKDAVTDPVTGKETAAVTLKIGSFLQTLVDFIIIAFSVFMILKGIIGLKKKKIEDPPVPPAPTKDQELLSEIRDLLKNK